MSNRPLALLGVAALTAGLLSVPAVAHAEPGPVVYDSIPDSPRGNYTSFGFQATSTDELGNLIELAGDARTLGTVTVAFSSWACETGSDASCATSEGASFDHPITVNVYSPAEQPDADDLLATVTETVDVPYRPSADPANCDGGTG